MKIFLFLISLFLAGCGKLENFARLDDRFTRVYLDADPRLVSMDGGLMIYFISTGDPNYGRVFGFPSKGDVVSKSVVVPNGSYRVFFLGTTGANKIEGQAKCGRGNGGNPVLLNGGSTTIGVDMTASACGFGTANEFGLVNSANSGNSNFDTMSFTFCTGTAYPSCNAATGANYRLKLRMLGGTKPGSGSFSANPAESLTSDCSPAMGSGTINSSFIGFTGGNLFSPPMEVLIYNDATCSAGVVGTVNLFDGLKSYLSVASGSNVFVDSPSTNNVTTLKFYFP